MVNFLHFALNLALLASFVITFNHCAKIVSGISKFKRQYGRIRFGFISFGTSLVIGGAMAIFLGYHVIGGDMVLIGLGCKLGADRRSAIQQPAGVSDEP